MQNEPRCPEWAELLWKEFEYRHNVYWKSLYLWGGAATALAVAPFLKPELSKLGKAIFIFPILALAIAWIGAWHLAAENARLVVVMEKYNELRGNFKPDLPYSKPRTWRKQAISESIGETVSFLFLFGFTAFVIVDFLFIYITLYPCKWMCPFITGIVILIITFAWFWLRINKRKIKFNKYEDKKPILPNT